MTSTPGLPPTLASAPGFAPTPPAPGLPFSHVDGRKQAAAPPPSVVLPSRAGGVDELVGGGLTLLGIGALKLMFVGVAILGLGCILSMIGLAFR